MSSKSLTRRIIQNINVINIQHRKTRESAYQFAETHSMRMKWREADMIKASNQCIKPSCLESYTPVRLIWIKEHLLQRSISLNGDGRSISWNKLHKLEDTIVIIQHLHRLSLPRVLNISPHNTNQNMIHCNYWKLPSMSSITNQVSNYNLIIRRHIPMTPNRPRYKILVVTTWTMCCTTIPLDFALTLKILVLCSAHTCYTWALKRSFPRMMAPSQLWTIREITESKSSWTLEQLIGNKFNLESSTFQISCVYGHWSMRCVDVSHVQSQRAQQVSHSTFLCWLGML